MAVGQMEVHNTCSDVDLFGSIINRIPRTLCSQIPAQFQLRGPSIETQAGMMMLLMALKCPGSALVNGT